MKQSDDLPKLPKAPVALSAEAKVWWRKLNEDYVFEEHELLVLESALESFDRMRESQAIIKREGAFIFDRFKQRKAHPALLTERDAKLALARNMKLLNLKLEPLKAPGRPPGRGK